jgi:hypothetical protein
MSSPTVSKPLLTALPQRQLATRTLPQLETVNRSDFLSRVLYYRRCLAEKKLNKKMKLI